MFFGGLQRAISRSPTGVPVPTNVTWRSPSNRVIKLNFYGALFQNGAEVGIGVVARDCQDDVRAWLSHRFPRHVEPELAEALAARNAIDIALKHRWPSIILEGDCLSLINRLKSPATDTSSIGPLVWNIKSAASTFHSISFNHVSRVGNSLAHNLAKFASVRTEGLHQFSVADVQQFVLSDSVLS
ncbi:UNVERIFIED_CONTAM: hypothetical protein Slati_0908700 [Sesamum latifolium]|uniref:RNase H type-1 domain-containing protein n=1 Tax=Sesamum latifolium TaxID=2727402 RepID=A0AAW2XNQ9_9LAMI